MSASIDPRTPVLVAWSQVQQRLPAGEGKDALGLMIQALREAGAARSGANLLQSIQWLGVPRGMWAYGDPAHTLAQSVGASAHTVMAEIGVLQQSLINRACQGIAAGEFEVAAVVGGEAKYRQQQAQRAGIELSDSQIPGEAAEVWRPADEIWSEVESGAGLAMPVGYYALMESALRARDKQSPQQHREQLATLYAGFSEIAAANPHAWQRKTLSAKTILKTGSENRMLAYPYIKLHNTQWNVDQAAALIFCSVGCAERLGIPRQFWIFPRAGTESNHMVNTAQRADLAACPGARVAGKQSLQLAGLTAEQLDLVELYSCFPAAVRIYARELGLSEQRVLTVTGSMAFAGGPLNNYVLQATARTAELMAAGEGQTALVASVSGMLTKQGFGVYATTPGAERFGFADVTATVAAEHRPLPLRAAQPGERLRVAACTVLYGGDGPGRAILVADTEDAQRTVVWSDAPAVMASMQEQEWVGRGVRADAGGRFNEIINSASV